MKENIWISENNSEEMMKLKKENNINENNEEEESSINYWRNSVLGGPTPVIMTKKAYSH